MPIDAEKLRRFAIPAGRQTIAPRDIALYALSVGMGRDPLDEAQLDFVDPQRGPRMLPSMALVMAHPGFWLADPETGVDPATVLHADQRLEILTSLPNEGDVRSRTRVTRLIDKGLGKAALVLTETNLFTDNDICFARLERTTFIRNGGGFGGDRGETPAREAAPSEQPDVIVDLGTGREQALLYRLNGDLNPLHSDPATASAAGFAMPVLHGLCTMGIVTHALVRALCGYASDRLRFVTLRFVAPLFPGETVRTEIWNDGRFQARSLERDAVIVDQGRAVITAGSGKEIGP